MSELLRMENITKSFPSANGGERLEILKDINLTLHGCESISITGRSGSGKSTLLSIAALLSLPTSGNIYYSGSPVEEFSDSSLSSLRNKYMGFIFQNSMLLEDFTARENVAMPLLIRGVKKKEAFQKADYYLSLVDMTSRLFFLPSVLSGGERQRVAIARALSPECSIIFADEPTGSLDEETSLVIENLLYDVVKREKRGLIVVTHNTSFASRADRKYTLMGGVLYEK